MDDITKQVVNLSPAKRALLELRLKQKPTDIHALRGSATPERRSKPKAPKEQTGLERQAFSDDIARRVANLSPAKRALLARRFKQKPADLSRAMGDYAPVTIPQPEPKTESSDWPIPTSPGDTEAEAEVEIPDWLADIVSEDIEPPEWLLDETSDTEILVPTPSESVELAETGAPPAPDWMAGSDVLTGETKPDRQADTPAAPAPEPAESPSSGWLESLRPVSEAVADDEDSKLAESTGMLAGISTLLPAEKVSIPTPETGDKTNGLHQAAQEFLAIATAPPQPATLPAPLTRREQVVGSVVRAALHILFIILIALPLIPGVQKIVDNRTVPWSEPSGTSSDVLDSQRRQLISEQLGIIDLQQPDSVALVSFDYSTATQGEMQPLAEAVVSRLKGQGMRIISVSLEPEGAAIAQKTLEGILSERGDLYGANMINLGYLPGRIAAIRALATDQASLSTIPDFKENLPLENRPEWSDVQNLGQVDIVVTFADNPTTARWWIEQLEMAPQPEGSPQFLLAATSAGANPFLRPYRESNQLDGLISGISGAAAIEAGRKEFGPARQMIDSLAIATIIIIILIAAGTVVGWMPASDLASPATDQYHEQNSLETDAESKNSKQV